MTVGSCRFCTETLPDTARRCKHCGEPQGWGRYFWGMVLKYIPLLSLFLSVLVPIISVGFAYVESQAARQAQVREANAMAALHATEQGASHAIARLQARLPESTKEDILRSLPLSAGATEGTLERAVESAPASAWQREQLLLYRALKEPNRP